jgi:hypothetical protein
MVAQVNPIKLQKALGGMDYLASKEDLVNHAEEQDADEEEVLSFLRDLPDKNYETPGVNKEMS